MFVAGLIGLVALAQAMRVGNGHIAIKRLQFHHYEQ
jgi:hypothetical protein